MLARNAFSAGPAPGGRPRVRRVLAATALGVCTVLTLDMAAGAADPHVSVHEHRGIYSVAVAVLPYPNDLRERAAEGVRNNITHVFNAVAHHNPWPAEYFDENAWNQMVLKALFVDSKLYLIHNFDKRVNKNLANMLVDFSHERRAAGRSISPELWRAVAPFAVGDILDDLKQELEQPDPLRQKAAALALMEKKSEASESLLNHYPKIRDEVIEKNISWDEIGAL